MSNKKIVMLCLVTAFLMFFISQNAFAGPDWKEKQKQMFAQIPVKPGDVINTSNWEKVKDLVPEAFLTHGVKTGDWILEIGEFEYDHDFDAAYKKLSAKNKGKYGLGENKEIIDLKTGKYPMYMEGNPFPDVDASKDPDGAIKVMHNNTLGIFMQGRYEGITYPEKGNLQWIGRKSAYEKGVGFTSERNYWWNRPDGEIPNPRKLKQTVIPVVTYPFDLLGTATLYTRHLDGRPDSVYAYVPAIRRVKRLSGANRSDPQMGSDMTMDDAGGFAGHVESMNWKFIDKKIMLKPIWKKDAKQIRQLKRNKIGAWEFNSDNCTDAGYEKPGWNGAPWAYTNLVWIPRETYTFKVIPKDPFYNYGAMEICVDTLTAAATYNMKYSRAGELWKYIVQSTGPGSFGGRNFFSIDGPMCVVDIKTDHASILDMDGNLMTWDTPRVNPLRHTPQNLKTMGK